MNDAAQQSMRIFVSHSHQDNEFGVKLVQDLREALGDESAVWYDASGGLHGGVAWWRTIVDEISSRPVFLVILSPDAMESKWVADEIDLAWAQKNSAEGKHVIPLLYRDCTVRADLKTRHIVSFLPSRSYEQSLDDLLVSLGLSPRHPAASASPLSGSSPASAQPNTPAAPPSRGPAASSQQPPAVESRSSAPGFAAATPAPTSGAPPPPAYRPPTVGAPLSPAYRPPAAGAQHPVPTYAPAPAASARAGGLALPARRRGAATGYTIAAIALAVTVAFVGVVKLLPALSGGVNPGPSDLAANQTLHMAWGTAGTNDVSTLDPSLVNDVSEVPITALIFDGLVTMKNDLQVEPWAAQRYDLSSDRLTYTFHLRAGQTFSDGTPVKASDFAYTINRSLHPCIVPKSVTYTYLIAIKHAATFSGETCAAGAAKGAIHTLIGDSIVANDSVGILTITLERPSAYFLAALSYPTSYAIESRVVTGDNLGVDGRWMANLTSGATGQGGSGMFYLSAWDHSGHLTLKANPHWWGRAAGKKPYLTEIDYDFHADAEATYQSYISGQTDYSQVPSTDLVLATSRHDFHESPELSIFTVTMNWRTPPFDNLKARQAFCLALNRDTLTTQVLKGAATPSWHLVPKGMPGYYSALTGINGTTSTGDNGAAAQQVWSAYKASLGNQPVPAISFTYDPTGGTNLPKTMIAMWNNALPGANVQAVTMPERDLVRANADGTVQLHGAGWIADYPDPQDFLSLLYATGAPYNDQHASDPPADALLAAADATSAPSQVATRMSRYNQAEQLLVNDVATCPLYQGIDQYVLRGTVHGYSENASGVSSLDNWVNTYITNQ